MTKMIKMSLIAAVAVTGMTSVVSAQPLEDAIKGVDVSGQLRYRYDDTSYNGTAEGTLGGTAYAKGESSQTNEYTMKVAVKSKVNDAVTANVQIEALGVNAGAAVEKTHATNDGTGDRDVNLVVSKANFTANLGFATVTAGKQSVPSPFVDNSADDATRGTGAVALVPAGPVTIAAGYFNNYGNTPDSGGAAVLSGENITAVAVLGEVAGVNFDAWLVDVDAVASAQSIGAKASVAGINLDARYSKKNPDAAGAKDSSLTKLVASTKIGAASVVAGIAVTGKDNSDISLDGDADAVVGFRLWQAAANKLDDSTSFLIGAGMEVMPAVTVDAKYLTVSAKAGAADVDASELLLGATYAMSKNFGVHARMSWYEVDVAGGTTDMDRTKGRLEVKYTF